MLLSLVICLLLIVIGCGRTTSEISETNSSSNVAPSIVRIWCTAAGTTTKTESYDFQAFVLDPNEPTSNLTYCWDFGDGTTSNEKTPRHTYCWNGSFDFSLIIYDKEGASSGQALSSLMADSNGPVVLTGRNDRPIINSCTATPPTASHGTSITFTGSATDPDAADIASLTYLWDFGDGTTANGAESVGTAHSYARTGLYYPKLTVTDQWGASITQGVVGGVGIGVKIPPVISSVTWTPSMPTVSQTVTFSCTAVGIEGPVASYVWQIYSRNEDGYTTKLDEVLTGQTVTYMYNFSGTFSVILIVTDTQDQSSTTMNYITIAGEERG